MKKSILCQGLLLLLFPSACLSQWYLLPSPTLEGFWSPPNVFEGHALLNDSTWIYANSFNRPSTGTTFSIYLTQDRGENFYYTEGNTFYGYFHGLEVDATNQAFYYCAYYGNGCGCMMSTSQGEDWHYAIGAQGYVVSFAAPDTNHFFLFHQPVLQNIIYLTVRENGQITSKIDSIAASNIRYLSFPDSATGYLSVPEAGGNTNELRKWQKDSTGFPVIFSDSSFTIRGVNFFDADHGILTGDSGRIFKTTDGGTTWQFQQTPVQQTLFCSAFFSPLVGYIGGAYGTILITRDGGNTWTQDLMSTPDMGPIFKLDFLPGGTCIAYSPGALFSNKPLPEPPSIPPPGSGLLIFPNPSGEIMTVIPSAPLSNATLKVINVLGQELFTEEHFTGDEILLDVRSLRKGNYWLLVWENEKLVYRQRFVAD